MMKGIWEKIYLGIQQAAAADGYDIVWDKSTDPLVYVNPKYDLTVKVMKVLGIDADSLEKRQKDVIDTDPRNKGQRETIKRGSRRRSTSREEPQDTTSVNPVGGPSAPIGTNPANLPPMEQPTPPPADTTRNDEDIPR
jgi:hypothetical protein